MGILLANPITKVMGWIMNGIFEFLYAVGLKDVGLNIIVSTILFTIIIYTLLLPLTIKQQKFSRISSVMNPEIQAIQNKYKGKNDQASMMKMQEETKLIYQKYGTSPTGGCLGSLIQLPFLFALWPVMRNITEHVGRIDESQAHSVLGVVISGTEKIAADTPSTLLKSGKPWLIVVAILIPVFAGASQWISGKIAQNSMKSKENKKDENAMAQQMNTMMNIMPLMSVFLCFSMEIVLGLYWITSAVVRTVQQVVINKSLDKKSLDDIIKQNMEKVAKKNKNKNAVESRTVNYMAQTSTKKIEDRRTTSNNIVDSYQSNAKPGSLAAKANMVTDYNRKNNK